MKSLGDRMKEYENVSRPYLIKRMPVIIRIDGVHFSSFTKGMEKPFDKIMQRSMIETMFDLCESIQGCKFGYVQSDEISLLLTDYDNLETSSWFNNSLTKLVSVSASMATMCFNNNFRCNVKWHCDCPCNYYLYVGKQDTAYFDSRAFNLTKEEVCNYFVWRQQDCIRNSIEALGRSKFSQKQLQHVNCDDIKTMLKEVYGVDWNDCPLSQQRGVCAYRIPEFIDESGKERFVCRWDENIPIFSENRDFIEKHLE
jgi:tRNA(His) 5'-end guanylyltransferase